MDGAGSGESGCKFGSIIDNVSSGEAAPIRACVEGVCSLTMRCFASLGFGFDSVSTSWCSAMDMYVVVLERLLPYKLSPPVKPFITSYNVHLLSPVQGKSGRGFCVMAETVAKNEDTVIHTGLIFFMRLEKWDMST